MGRFLTICAIATIGSGCCANPVAATLDLPPRPVLIDISPSTGDTIEAFLRHGPEGEVREAVREFVGIATHNDLSLKEYARKLQGRIEAHNETVQ